MTVFPRIALILTLQCGSAMSGSVPVNWGDVVSAPCTRPWPTLDIRPRGLPSLFKSPSRGLTTVVAWRQEAPWTLVVRNSTRSTIVLESGWEDGVLVGALPADALPHRFSTCNVTDEANLVDVLASSGCTGTLRFAKATGQLTLDPGARVQLSVFVTLAQEGEFKLAAWLRRMVPQVPLGEPTTDTWPIPTGNWSPVTVKRDLSGAERAWLLWIEGNDARNDGDSARALALIERARQLAPTSAFLAAQHGLWLDLAGQLGAAMTAFDDCIRIHRVTGGAPDPVNWDSARADVCGAAREDVAARLSAGAQEKPREQ